MLIVTWSEVRSDGINFTFHVSRVGQSRDIFLNNFFRVGPLWRVGREIGNTRAALVPSLGGWRRAQELSRFLLLKRAQIWNIPYIKWAYKITNVSHLISKIREVMRPWKHKIYSIWPECAHFLCVNWLCHRNVSHIWSSTLIGLPRQWRGKKIYAVLQSQWLAIYCCIRSPNR